MADAEVMRRRKVEAEVEDGVDEESGGASGEEDALLPDASSPPLSPTPPVEVYRRPRWHFPVACAVLAAIPLYAAVQYLSSDVAAISDPVVQPDGDTRAYEYMTLTNGLTALLISDDQADAAAAALDVKVGSMADPPQFEGLAHFLEHMCFLGSRAYPDEGGYNAFLAANGGTSNAFTDTQDTNYYFQANPTGLRPVLDRFANFFVAPLLTASSMSREMLAVASEHAKNLLSDAWRQFQLLKHLSSPNTPFHMFSTGSLDTLNKTGVHTALLDFHNVYYTADRMRLVVLGPQSIVELRTMVSLSFDAVREAPGDAPSRLPAEPPTPSSTDMFPPGTLGRVVSVIPVSDVNEVGLFFPLAPQYREKPAAVVAALLGEESAGSLASYLKAEGIAASVAAGFGLDTVASAGLSLTLTLIPAYADAMGGHNSTGLHTVLHAVFAYAGVMRRDPGGVKAYFEEQRALRATAWNWPTRQAASSEASALAGAMHHRDPARILDPPSAWTYDAGGVAAAMAAISPRNAVVFDVSQRFNASSMVGVEPVYGTPYTVSALPGDVLAGLEAATLPGAFHLPPRNPFVHASLGAVLPVDPLTDPQPVAVSDMDGLDVWWAPDAQFQRPSVAVRVALDLPLEATAAHSVMLTMYMEAVRDTLQEAAYLASAAGYEYKVSGSAVPPVLQLTLAGWSVGMGAWVAAVVNATAAPAITPARFLATKASIEQELENLDERQPYQHAVAALRLMLRTEAFDVTATRQAAATVTFDDFVAFVGGLLSRGWRGRALVHGNVDQVGARKLGAVVTGGLPPAGPLPMDTVAAMQPSVSKLGDGGTLQAPLPNQDSVNHAAVRYYQFGLRGQAGDAASMRRHAVFLLVTHLIAQPAFNVLRTQEQLGYVCGAYPFSAPTWVKEGDGRGDVVLGMVLLAQGNVKRADVLDSRLVAFAEAFQAMLGALGDADVAAAIEAVKTQMAAKPLNLGEAAERWWKPIASRGGVGVRAAVLAVLEGMAEEQLGDVRHELVALYRRYVRSQVGLGVEMFGDGMQPPFPAPTVGDPAVGDVWQFVASHEAVWDSQ